MNKLRELIYVAIRTAPEDVLSDIRNITTPKADDASVELAEIVVETVRKWANKHDFMDE
ncbi:hypothetical protein [Henriciella barbarensis]|uniref:hypothetical protein n=1 Tax=Henriciella barbarensis TaxID=86342 RepID=UPI0015FD4C4A|nr:hypothetical protein [Henriciella barbarensis]